MGGFAGGRSLREATEAFLGSGARFLRVAGVLKGAAFGCGEARPLVERQVTRVREGSGLVEEEERGMVRKWVESCVKLVRRN